MDSEIAREQRARSAALVLGQLKSRHEKRIEKLMKLAGKKGALDRDAYKVEEKIVKALETAIAELQVVGKQGGPF